MCIYAATDMVVWRWWYGDGGLGDGGPIIVVIGDLVVWGWWYGDGGMGIVGPSSSYRHHHSSMTIPPSPDHHLHTTISVATYIYTRVS